MKNVLRIVFSIMLLASVESSFAASEGGNQDGNKSGERRGPPPGAFTACEGKAVGDTASFVDDRRGETMTGTCREMRGELVLKPEGHGERGERGERKDASKGASNE